MSTGDLQKAIPASAGIDTVRERAERRLEYLSQDLEPDEMPPPEAAKRACIRMLTAAAATMPVGQPFPFPHISTGGEGDLTCEWARDRCVVVALISPQGVAALHEMKVEAGRVTSHRTTANVQANDVGAALERWLSAESGS